EIKQDVRQQLLLDYVGSLQTFRALSDFKGNRIAFCKRLEAVPGNRRKMNKNIFAPFLLDEPKPFCVVKPFNFALCHFLPPFLSGLRRSFWLPLKFLESDAGKAQSLVKHVLLATFCKNFRNCVPESFITALKRVSRQFTPGPDKQDKCVNEGILCHRNAENTF